MYKDDFVNVIQETTPAAPDLVLHVQNLDT
jgi:hypothetical protein